MCGAEVRAGIHVTEPSVGVSWKAIQAHLLCLGIYYLIFISSSEMGNLLFLDWPHKEPE